MTACNDCGTETDYPYCCGNNERVCEKCADKRFTKGVKNGIVTLGVMEITTEWPKLNKNQLNEHKV